MLDQSTPTSFNRPGIDDLVRRWQEQRDERARDRLLREYTPTIQSFARKFGTQWKVDPDDAFQEASLGFLRALETYDPTKASLAGYAGQWIRVRVTRARMGELAVTVPFHSIDEGSRLGKTKRKLRKRLGRSATDAEIAAELRWTPGRVKSAAFATLMLGGTRSMSEPIGQSDDGDLTLSDILADDATRRPDVIAASRREASDARAAIVAAAATLRPRDRQLLQLRFVRGLTLEQCGEGLHVTRERARQLESRVIKRMKIALSRDVRALEVIGHSPAAPEGETLRMVEVIRRVGHRREKIDRMIERGEFPRPAGIADHERFWSSLEVASWVEAHGRGDYVASPKQAGPSQRDPNLIQCGAVLARTGLTRIRLRLRVEAGTFPAPVNEGARPHLWDIDKVDAWIAAQASGAAGDASPGIAAPEADEPPHGASGGPESASPRWTALADQAAAGCSLTALMAAT